MKLGKRLKFIYICTFFTSIAICFGFYIGFSNGAEFGDIIRITEISKGVQSSLTSYLDRQTKESELLTKIIEADSSSIVFSEDIKYTAFISSNKSQNVVLKNNLPNDLGKEILNSISDFKTYTSSQLYLYSDSIYVITAIPVNNTSSDYVTYISEFDESLHEYISKSTNSITSIHYGLNTLPNDSYKNIVHNTEHLFSETTDYISIYLPLDINSKDIFLEVTQPKDIHSLVISNFSKYMLLFMLLFSFVNLMLYLIIKISVVKRILSLNKAIKNITNENINLELSDSKKYNDEITDLTTEISNMSTRLTSASNVIKDTELKNKEILKTMTNGFIYCKAIIDEDNKIIDGEILEINNTSKDLFNIKLNNRLSDINPNFLTLEFLSILNNSLLDKNISSTYELQLSNSRWVSFSMNSIFEGYFFIITNDITDLKHYSEEMKYLATYDTLTSLYNRRMLLEFSNELTNKNIPYNLFFIDLDDFKKINDTIGHDYGDMLLIEVSKQLIKLGSKTVKIGRLGGDEFIVIREGNFSHSELECFSNEIINCISNTYKLKNSKFNLKVSMGISSFPKDGKSYSSIIKYADIAMYNSKQLEGNSYTIFERGLLADLDLEDKLIQALKTDEIVTYFQPIYNISSNSFDSAEALVRWHSKDGLISPNSFIPLAKRTGLIFDIDKLVFTESCKFCSEYKMKYGKYIIVSVNISHRLLSDEGFVNFIISTIEEYNIPKNYLQIEITEDETIKDLPYTISILENLKSKGLLIALDDFGVGYSSFNYINKLPLDTIKIDKSLISSINNKKSYTLIQDLITLLKSLDLEIICEGVEERSQFDQLKELGAHEIQGFLFSKPLNRNDFLNFIDNFKI